MCSSSQLLTWFRSLFVAVSRIQSKVARGRRSLRRARKLPEGVTRDQTRYWNRERAFDGLQGGQLPDNQVGDFAARNASITPFRVIELLERARALEAQGRDVIHLEVGEPDFPTAAPIVAAAHRALEAGATRYTQALGIPALREAISGYYERQVGIRVPPSRVIVTSGASGGLLLLMALLIGPDDELLLTDPGYPCNEVFVWLTNGTPVRIPLRPERQFLLNAADVDAHWSERTRGLLLASPANPTGAMLASDSLRSLADLVRQRQGFLILDEIYQGLVYETERPCRSGLEVAEDLYVLNSFSKYFGMTGWRLGWMVVPEAAVEPLARLAQNLFISPPSLSQHAALAAFSEPALEIHELRRQAFERRRDVLVNGLESLGFGIPLRPAGAFYVYTDISRTGLDAMTFCTRLLEEHAVAVTPGDDFGMINPERWVRFAFTADEARIKESIERIRGALKGWGLA
ncbi:MAG TPA: aminotransferase [Gammaproteobacteria bacterium]|nr:aminotransferase [Gammaproteobacteria bacterium]